MKKLTQDDAKHAPFWARSMAVDKNGIGFYHSIEKDKLKTDGDQWWPKNRFDHSNYICGVMTGEKKTGNYFHAIEFDATDWQNSAIDIDVMQPTAMRL